MSEDPLSRTTQIHIRVKKGYLEKYARFQELLKREGKTVSGWFYEHFDRYMELKGSGAQTDLGDYQPSGEITLARLEALNFEYWKSRGEIEELSRQKIYDRIRREPKAPTGHHLISMASRIIKRLKEEGFKVWE